MVHLVALQHISGLDVVISVDLHAAFLPGLHFLRIILEPLQLGKLPVVLDNDLVTSDADEGIPFDCIKFFKW